MSASFIGSMVAWIITGAFTLVVRDVEFTDDPFVKGFLIAVILLVGVWYFYSFGSVQLLPEIREALLDAHIIEWLIRAFGLVVLFSLWFILERYGWMYFSAMLVAQHIIYLLWDLQVRNHLRLKWWEEKDETAKNKYWIIDTFGLLIAIALFVATNILAIESADGQSEIPPWILGCVTVAYGSLFVVGSLFLIKFKPFKYLKRGERR